MAENDNDRLLDAAMAQDLFGARAHRQQIAPLATRVAGFGIERAYRVSALLAAIRMAQGERPIGRKVGFTNRNIWPEYGVNGPIVGPMYASTVHRLARGRGTFAIGGLAQPRIEPELVFGFARAPAAGASLAQVLDCVEWVAHGFEIVDSHFRDWKFTAADTVADGALHAALLLGPPRPVREMAATPADLLGQLAAFSIELECDGTPRDRGVGGNVLDHPLEAVRFMQRELAAHDAFPPLAAGEMVTTGTLTGAMLIHPGETWSTRIHGLALDGIAVHFTA